MVSILQHQASQKRGEKLFYDAMESRFLLERIIVCKTKKERGNPFTAILQQ